MKEETMAGPAYCAAAWPVRTKMPAPMMAPMPSAVRLTGPSARLRLLIGQHLGLQVGDASAAKQIHAGNFSLFCGCLMKRPPAEVKQMKRK